MVTSIDTIMDDIVNTLEDNGYDPLPSAERTGSTWFKESQEIVFSRQMPKGKVFFDEVISDERSFSNVYEDTKTYVFNCVFFSRKGDKDSSLNIKNRELINHAIQNVETVLKANRINSAVLIGFGEAFAPNYDKANHTFIGVKSVIYKVRE